MALMTQADCDNVLEFKATQCYEADGVTFAHWHIHFVNENRVHSSFHLEGTAENADAATIKADAEAFMIANCEMEAAPIKTTGTEINLMAAE